MVAKKRVSLLLVGLVLGVGIGLRDIRGIGLADKTLTRAISPREEALAISQAFAAKDAKKWRQATTAQLSRIDSMSRDELTAAAQAYRMVATERGIQGLESTLLSTLAALGHRDFTGWLRARDELTALNKKLWVAPELAGCPQARIAIKSTASPVIYHMPLHLARRLLMAQVQRGVAAKPINLNNIVKEDLCSEASIAQFEQRWGKGYADQLRSVCQGAGVANPTGGVGAGNLAGMSEFNCLPSHEQTRAERVSELLGACLASQVDGAGNPLALERQPGWTVSTYAYAGAHDERNVTYTRKDGNGNVVEEHDEFKKRGRLVMKREVFSNSDGSVKKATLSFYDESKNKTQTVSFDESKNQTITTYNDGKADPVVVKVTSDGKELRAMKDGKLDEMVTLHDDGSYTVKQYGEDGKVTSDVTYDKNSKPKSQVGTPTAGWAKTPQCRALTIELMREGAKTMLATAGGVDPHTINPNPEAQTNTVPEGELGCFEMTGGARVDAALGCADGLKLCGPGQMVDQNCACGPVSRGVEPSTMCGISVVCADGKQPKEKNGECSCGDAEELFVDPIAGGGPQPVPRPIDRMTR